MIEAVELKAGTVIKREGELLSVISAEHHAGGGQLGGAVFAKARSLRSHHVKELRFHPDDRLEDVELERQDMEYLYGDDSGFYFMNPETFEQIGVPKEAIGPFEKFLQPNMRIPVELYEGSPVNVAFPPAVDLKV